MALSRPKHGFESRWGRQRQCIFLAPFPGRLTRKISRCLIRGLRLRRKIAILSSPPAGLPPAGPQPSPLTDWAPMNYRNTEMKIDQLVNYFNEEKINLSPAFQRGHVWKLRTRRQLIANIVQGRPIPAIFLYKEASGARYSYNILDGSNGSKASFCSLVRSVRTSALERGPNISSMQS